MKRHLRDTVSRLGKGKMKKIKILIVDDQWMIRDGLSSFLKKQHEQYIFLTAEAENGAEAVAKVKKSDYDIVLMDYQMPKLNGAEATKVIVDYKPELPVLALSNYNEPEYVKNMLEAGAKGYMIKNIGNDELIKAVIIVLNGGSYFSNEIDLKWITDKNNSVQTKTTPSGKELCEREISVLKLISEEHTSRGIADILHLSKRTIDKYRRQLLAKMEVRNVAGLLKRARELKLLDS